jgi:predicted ATP-grasp superfamily ATP-dependent carboligase
MKPDQQDILRKWLKLPNRWKPTFAVAHTTLRPRRPKSRRFKKKIKFFIVQLGKKYEMMIFESNKNNAACPYKTIKILKIVTEKILIAFTEIK